METRRDRGGMIWGIVLLAIGLLLLLSNFGYGSWFGWGRWWPLILIVLGIVLLYRREPASIEQAPPGSIGGAGQPLAPGAGASGSEQTSRMRRRYPTAAIVLIGIGLAFLLEDYIGGNAFPALVLITIGVALLLRERATPR